MRSSLSIAWYGYVRRGWGLVGVLVPVMILFVLVTMLVTLEVFLSRIYDPALDSRTLWISPVIGAFSRSDITKIARVPGVVDASPMAWRFDCSVDVAGKPEPVTCMGATAQIERFMNRQLSEQVLATWEEHKNGVLVGSSLARRHGWHEGQLLTLLFNGKPSEFFVSSVFTDAPILDVLLMHAEYADARGGQAAEQYSACLVTVASPQARKKIDDTIWEMFKDTPSPTSSMAGESAHAMFLNDSRLLLTLFRATGILAIVIVACSALTLLTLSIDRRRGEFAALRAIGFQRSSIFRLIMAESVLLVFPGALLGSLIAFAYFRTNAWELTQTVRIEVSATTAALTAAFGFLLPLVLALLPARSAATVDVLVMLQDG